jgi:thioesterase domain-containing protein
MSDGRILVLFGLEGAAFSYGPWLSAARGRYPRRIVDIEHAAGRSVCEIATEQVGALLAEGLGAARPAFGGWSAGGVLAQEVARIWHDQTGGRAPVLLVDSSARTVDEPSEAALLRTFLRELSLNAELTVPGADGELAHLPPAEVLREVAAALRGRGTGYQPDAVDLMARLTAFATVTRLSRDHEPRPYGGPVHLVEAAEGTPKADAWAPLCGSLQVTRLPGNHYTVLRRAPGRLADIGARLLNEACASDAPESTSNINVR